MTKARSPADRASRALAQDIRPRGGVAYSHSPQERAIPKNLLRNLFLVTPCNLLCAAWAPASGFATLAFGPLVVGLTPGVMLLVFTGGAWVHYARRRYASARQYLLWSLALDWLTVALATAWAWYYPGMSGWS